MSETAILVAIREALSREPGVLIWRNNSGKLQDARGRWVTYGLGVGSADLVGLVQMSRGFCGYERDDGSAIVTARFFALEVKTETGRATKEQVCWSIAVRGNGGFCATVRSVEEAIAALKRCKDGETE